MYKPEKTVDAETLMTWLGKNDPVFVLDVRPVSQREEWQIPGSHYLDAYQRLKEGDESVLDEIEIPKDIKVVTVCAAARISQIASQPLQGKGFDAVSLEGGMKSWSKAWNIAEKRFSNCEILQVRRTGKGCLSYILSAHGEAIIVDASLPLHVYTQLVRRRRLSVKYVIETHIHADHLSRSKQVAEHFQTPLFLPVPNEVDFSFRKIRVGTQFQVGAITLTSLPTPGHTFGSYCFYVDNTLLSTGDTLFINGMGRPDLKTNADDIRAKAVLLYRSLKRLLSLPGHVLVLPGHTNKPIDFNGALISIAIKDAEENIPLLRSSENIFVSALLQRIPDTPANYMAIVEKNLKGEFLEADAVELEAGANRCGVS